MTTDAPPDLPLEQPSGPRPSAIRVVVGYPWTKVDKDRAVAPLSDKRWTSIRDCVTSVGGWVRTSISRRTLAPVPFVYEVARLRGTHGRMLLDNLRSRISESDILIMDIGSSDGKRFNPNVLLETGMAIAQQGGVLRDLFILKPAKRPVPSDLCGFLFTDYEVVDNEGAIKIVDVHGFQAALRSAVLRRARERNMIGQRNELYVGPEDEHEDDSPPAPSGDGGGAPN
jgi:hypothetical protein